MLRSKEAFRRRWDPFDGLMRILLWSVRIIYSWVAMAQFEDMQCLVNPLVPHPTYARNPRKPLSTVATPPMALSLIQSALRGKTYLRNSAA
jgi:hypothetical protein